MIIPDELYTQIRRLMPIPCVDLRVSDPEGRVLLVRRANDPARGHWWFPGGRVHFGETRRQAAERKLEEECGLTAISFEEIGTFDLLLSTSRRSIQSHGISTLFHVCVECPDGVQLDSQSSEAKWQLPEVWVRRRLHEFVQGGLAGEHQWRA